MMRRHLLRARGFFVILLLLNAGGCRKNLKMARGPLPLPPELQGLRLHMSGAELIAARPKAQKLSILFLSDQSEATDSSALSEDDLLFEAISSSRFFSHVGYVIRSGVVAGFELDNEFTTDQILPMRQQLVLFLTTLWGSPHRSFVYERKHGTHRYKSLAFEWKFDPAQITLAFALPPARWKKHSVNLTIADSTLFTADRYVPAELSSLESKELFRIHGLDEKSLKRARATREDPD